MTQSLKIKFGFTQLKRTFREFFEDLSDNEAIISMVFFIIGVSLVVASLAFIPQTSFAAGTGMTMSEPAPHRDTDIPRQHMVPVVMGGIGDQDEEAMKKAQGHYSLKLLFTSVKGMYLSNANVLLEDKRGNVYVNDEVDGPVLLADLEPGTYRLTAQYDGKVQVKRITINSKKTTHTMQIRFPIEEDGERVSTNTPAAAQKLQVGWDRHAGGLCMMKADYQHSRACPIIQSNR